MLVSCCCRSAVDSGLGRPYTFNMTVAFVEEACTPSSTLEITEASNPLSSIASTICAAVSFSGSCTMTARSANRLILNCTKPSTSLNPPSTADVQAPQVIPSMATVVVTSFRLSLRLLDFVTPTAGSASLLSTISASNPVSSIISATCSGVKICASCSTTALSESSEMLKDFTPATFLKAPSTAEVQAPQVMPPTLIVVVRSPVCSSSPPPNKSKPSSSSSSSSSFCAGPSLAKTSASNPRSSTTSLIS